MTGAYCLLPGVYGVLANGKAAHDKLWTRADKVVWIGSMASLWGGVFIAFFQTALNSFRHAGNHETSQHRLSSAFDHLVASKVYLVEPMTWTSLL